MGIGRLYKTVLENLGHDVVTVDNNIAKGADLPSFQPAILAHGKFNTIHICTPNFTHLDLASKLSNFADIIFVEKPGVEFKREWQNLAIKNPNTKFMMVKNNMWRSNILELQEKALKAKSVDIEWIRKNCIPSPGSWFTTKKLAFGGVSRDLMPHLLSLYISLNPEWKEESITDSSSSQNWRLTDITTTEYGTVYPYGTYDVDDQCAIKFGSKWNLQANWRSIDTERSAITFTYEDNSKEVFDLGWCPEDAYLNMIKDSINNLNSDEFWNNQLDIDLWIHERIEQF